MLEIEWYFTWLSQFVPQIGGKCEKLGLGRVGTPSFAAKPRRGKDRLRERLLYVWDQVMG